MKKNQILKVRLNDEMARKLSVVSEKERQTIQNEIIAMIRQKISYFERVKGNITRDEINNANMEQFETEEAQWSVVGGQWLPPYILHPNVHFALKITCFLA